MTNGTTRNLKSPSAPATPSHDAVTRFGAGVVVANLTGLVLIAFMRERGEALVTVVVAASIAAFALWVFRARGAGHPACGTAAASAAFIALALLVIGALALANRPDKDVSWMRVTLLALHVALMLGALGAASLTMWLLTGRPPARWHGEGADAAIVASMLFLTLCQAISGVLAALGTRIAPIALLSDEAQAALPPAAHFLQRLHGAHPVVAILTAAAVIRGALLLVGRRRDPHTKQLAAIASVLVMAQLAVGALNSAYFAPTPLRIPHLALAGVLWIAIVLLAP